MSKLWINFKKDLIELAIITMVIIFMILGAAPILGLIVVLGLYAPDWVVWLISLGWLPFLFFWNTIKGIFTNVREGGE